MNLTDMLSNMRIELQDLDVENQIYTEAELTRAVYKSVNLMSRLIPKRSVVEATITLEVTGETLTISSGTGTLDHKPIKKDTLSIPNKRLDYDYRINYLTGVVTSIGSNLPDNDYTVSYNLDSGIFDLSTILSDYIRLEKIEYPAGDSPPTEITGEVYGNFFVARGTIAFTENSHIRFIYWAKWTPPTRTASGDYPTHLDDAIIIGGTGQALIYKAERYTQASLDAIEDVTELLTLLSSMEPIIPTLTAPTPPSLGALTPPTGYTVSKPSAPTLPSVPTAPSAPSLSFTDVTTALTAIGTEISEAKAKLTSGEEKINAATRGSDVAANWGKYADTVMGGAARRADEALGHLRIIEATLAKYTSEVTAFGSEVNGFANETSGVIGKYREEINAEDLGIRNASADAQVFAAEVQAQQAQVNIYQSEVAGFQAEIANLQNQVNVYQTKASTILSRAQQRGQQIAQYLDLSGRYLASGQAKINEMLVMLGVKPEFTLSRASSEQRS